MMGRNIRLDVLGISKPHIRLIGRPGEASWLIEATVLKTGTAISAVGWSPKNAWLWLGVPLGLAPPPPSQTPAIWTKA